MLTLQNMVRDKEYDPEAAYGIATQRRQEAMSDITELLGQDTLAYWQFRFRLWFSSRFYYIREETVFYLGSAWPVLRPMALELGRRFVESGMLSSPRGIFFLRPPEIEEAIAARANGAGLTELVGLAEERDQLREARKRVHPPGSVPPLGDDQPGLKYKETQIDNADDAEVLDGFPVSPGTIVGEASLVLSAEHFDEMKPGTILVCPMTSPAWTQLFAHATGLVTDMGSILAHGSIVARECKSASPFLACVLSLLCIQMVLPQTESRRCWGSAMGLSASSRETCLQSTATAGPLRSSNRNEATS